MTPESRAVLIQWGWPKPCKPKCLNLGTSPQDDVMLVLDKQQVAALCLVLQNYFAKHKLPPPRMGWSQMEPNDGLGCIWGKLFQKESTEDICGKTPVWKCPAESIRKKKPPYWCKLHLGRRTAKLFMPWAPQRFREGCLEIWVLREAIIHHFCSLMSLLDLLVPCRGSGRREARRGCPAANLLWEIAHYSCCKSQYLPRSLSKRWFMRIWMWTDSLWLGVVLSCREFTPHQQKIISETPLVISSR